MSTIKIHTKANSVREIDDTDSVALGEAYIQLTALSKQIEAELSGVKKALIKLEPNHMYPDYKKKVVFEEGRDKTEINILEAYKTYRSFGRSAEQFLGLVSLSETALTKSDLEKEQVKKVLAEAKHDTGSKTAPMVKIYKMTPDELAEG